MVFLCVCTKIPGIIDPASTYSGIVSMRASAVIFTTVICFACPKSAHCVPLGKYTSRVVCEFLLLSRQQTNLGFPFQYHGQHLSMFSVSIQIIRPGWWITSVCCSTLVYTIFNCLPLIRIHLASNDCK